MFACISIRARVLLCLLATVVALLAITTITKLKSATAPATAVPVIMYHSILKDENRSGKYIVTPKTVEADFKYLTDRGYTAIFASELAEAVNTGGQLPEKPVIITLDDGYLNNLTYVLPLLEKYNMKAVIAVVGIFSEDFSKTPDHNPAYAHLTWEDIKELWDSGRVEIANHSYNWHRQAPRHGAAKHKGESDSDYRADLIKDTMTTQDLLKYNSGVTPTTYAYPFGQYSQEAMPMLKELGFTAIFTCYERVNYLTGPEVLFELGRFNREAGVSTEKFMKKLGILP